MNYSDQMRADPPTNGVHEDLHYPMQPTRTCGCTWMHERCETGKALAAQVHDAYLKKVRTNQEQDIQAWDAICKKLHEHIAHAMSAE